MPDLLRDGRNRLLVEALGVAVVWNVLGNLVLPGWSYVPANLVVAALLTWRARVAGLGWDELAMSSDRIGRGTVIGLGVALVVGAVLAIGLLVPAVQTALEDDAVRADSTFDHWFVPLLRIPLGTAVFEEVLFRAVLLGVLLARHSARAAVVISSVVFGFWHVVPAWETANGSAPAVVGAVVGTVAITTVAGVGFAVLRLWARSILAPILAHAATNSFGYAAALIALEIGD